VHPEIHWNAGNAGRSCLAAGAQLHLVKPLGFSLGDREVRRAGLDYWPRVQPRVWESLEEIEHSLGSGHLGEPFYFAPGRGRSLFDVRLPPEVALVFGRESDGLPPELLDRHEPRLVHLPMLDPALRSLNLSTTVGIALYESLRQSR
jgi:tRNA (cytidine/uridine-2'-O-)-methyltransferase